MRTYIASELFTANVNGNFPLDVKFLLKAAEVDNKELFTRGIYTLSFKGELLYIGSYSGQENVAVVRWQNELQTHSIRGLNVGFTPAAWRKLHGTQQLRSANFPSRIVDSGYLTSAKRVLFAEENWHLLSQHPDDWLSCFSICWMPAPAKLKRSKKELQMLTNQLRKFNKPRCNG